VGVGADALTPTQLNRSYIFESKGTVSVQETWIEIAGYPNYAVSNYGQVINVVTDTILKPRPNDRGYLRVRLSNDEDHGREFYIHKLVGQAFFNFPLEEHTIHYDDDKNNNSVSNLRLRKRVRTDISTRPLRGQEKVEYQRQWGKRIRIIETAEVFRTVRDCARYINGDYSSIYACLRGDRSSHRGFTFEYHD
jgi:hypothetical protein